jgi:glycosyltransferase involved in cell wall biosynthesis
MKFLMLLPSTVRGGVEEYALKIMVAAAQQGWEVHAAFPQTDQTTSLIKDLTAKGIQYHRLEIGEGEPTQIGWMIRFLRTLFLLLKLRPSVAQIVLPWIDRGFGSIMACGLLQIPLVVRFGLLPPYPVHQGERRIKLANWARARNQQWVAVSNNNRKLISESFQMPLAELRCIYNGTRTVASSHDSPAIQSIRQEVRQQLGLKETDQIAITVGRLAAQKGHSYLIPAIPHLVKEFPDLRFVWIGDGEERENLVSQLQSYEVADRVLLLGYRSDVSTLLSAADLFIFPTCFEGHPSALLEAMAHRLPIVASNASSIPEIIEPGVQGLLFRVQDSCDLLESLRWALRHPQEMQIMAANAQQRTQQFSVEKMFEETLGLLQSLACRSTLDQPASLLNEK